MILSPSRLIVLLGLILALWGATPLVWGQGKEKRNVEFNFANVEVRTLVDVISKATKRSFLLNENDIAGRRITIISQKKYTPSEALAIFEAILDANDLTTINEGVYTRVVQKGNAQRALTPVSRGSRNKAAANYGTTIVQVKNASLHIVTETIRQLASPNTVIISYAPADLMIIRDTRENRAKIVKLIAALDKKEAVEARRFRLNSISAVQLKNILMQALDDLNNGAGRIFLLEENSTNSLIAVSVRSSIARIEQLIEQVDLPASNTNTVQVRILNLRHAPARNTAALVKSVFAVTVQAKKIPFSVVADERTNRLIVTSQIDTLDKVEVLLQQLDKKVEQSISSYRVYYLNNSSAEEVAGVLQKVTKSISLSVAGQKKEGDKASDTGEQSNSEVLSTPKVDTKDLKSSISIIPDKATNALVVYASPNEFPLLEKVISDLDTVRPQVFVEALIVEMTLDKSLNIGVDWKVSSFVKDSSGAVVGGGTFTSGARASSPSTFAAAAASAPAGAVVGILGKPITFGDQSFSSYSAFVQAARKDGEINILSNPQVMTLNNKESEFKVGEVRPFQTTIKVNSDSTTTRSFDYKDVGISLKITPRVNSDNSVRMLIKHESKEIKRSTESGDQTNFTPVTLNRSITTNVVVQDGNTIVLGGLISDSIETSEAKIPCLGDIPFMGWLFKSVETKRRKNNLMVFITPTVLRNPGAVEARTDEFVEDFDAAIKNRFRLDLSEEIGVPGIRYPRPEGYPKTMDGALDTSDDYEDETPEEGPIQKTPPKQTVPSADALPKPDASADAKGASPEEDTHTQSEAIDLGRVLSFDESVGETNTQTQEQQPADTEQAPASDVQPKQ